MSLRWRRLTLLGGPAFFVVWFFAGQILFFALGGDVPPSQAEYGSMAIANAADIRLGATMLVAAAGLLMIFGGALRSEVEKIHGLGLVAAGGAFAIALLLVLQGGLAFTSVELAAEAPHEAWLVAQLSDGVGFESFPVSLLAAVTLFAVAVVPGKASMASWLWWTTMALAIILVVGGILEGLGIVVSGRFSIFFGLWATTAGLALAIRPSTTESTHADSSPIPT